LVQDHKENIVQMSNGCICCTIRGDLVEALNELWEQRKDKKISFDRVVIETTGVANPGPVAQTFFMDDDVADHYVLDAVVTLVDAKHGQQQLTEHEEAQRQVGFADQIFITKTDLVSPADVEALKARLMHMNPRAPISAISKGVVPLNAVLDLKGFNLNAKLDIDPHFLVTTTLMIMTIALAGTIIAIMTTMVMQGIRTASNPSFFVVINPLIIKNWKTSSGAFWRCLGRRCCAIKASSMSKEVAEKWCSRGFIR
jgi:G3E family GTPase